MMRVPVVILGFSLIGLALGLALPGFETLAILSVITGAAALILLFAALLRPPKDARDAPVWGFGADASGPVAVLDGSNIMHWKHSEPDLAPVRDVIADLARRGYRVGVVFDANAGYKLEGRYRHHDVLARALSLPQDQVMVVNKGEIADVMILRVAQDFEARVVSNDRFRDWNAQFPQVAKPGFLISGRYRNGALQLDL